MNDQHEIAAPVVKVVSAWTAVGVASWTDLASFVASLFAAIYSAILIGEWAWKKFRKGRASE